MILSVVKIGNSRGVRIPKAILEQCRITDQLELEVHEGEIVLRPLGLPPRQGWAEAFATMHERGEDRLMVSESVDTQALDWEW